jgi:hypothetical protein
MKGIYLTLEAKQDIEAKIKQIRINDYDGYEDNEDFLSRKYKLEQEFIDNLLSSATILPVEERLNLSVVSINPFKQGNLKSLYPQGVIIQPKQ